jgi:hypothetical protein
MTSNNLYEYDVCISFAGEDRIIAERISCYLQSSGLTIFYDSFRRDDLIGKDLYFHLQDVYANKSRFCVILVSQYYAQKRYTMKVEYPAANARNTLASNEYLIPIRLDKTDLPGLLPTVGYLDLFDLGEEEAMRLVAMKILKYRYKMPPALSFRNTEEGFLMEFNKVKSSQLIDLLCHYIYSSSTAEIRIATLTPLRLLESSQFRLTLLMLSARLREENRNGTLRMYCLSKDTDILKKVVSHTREPLDIPPQKLEKSKEIITQLLDDENIKKHLRIALIHYTGIIPFLVFQVADNWLFSSHKFGQKRDEWSLCYFDSRKAPSIFVDGFHNFFLDLDIRSEEVTLNWF